MTRKEAEEVFLPILNGKLEYLNMLRNENKIETLNFEYQSFQNWKKHTQKEENGKIISSSISELEDTKCANNQKTTKLLSKKTLHQYIR